MKAATTELVYGQHAVAAVLDGDPDRVREAWLQRGRDNRLAARLTACCTSRDVPLHVLPRARLDALFPGARHQGVIVRATAAPANDLKGLLARLAESPAPLVVALDGVEDPHNLGAILRTADAAGADAVVVPRSRGAPLSAAARKVASGAAERVPLVSVANLARALDALADAGLAVVGTAADAPDLLFDQDLCAPVVLVLGAEGRGLRPLTARCCTRLVSLPMRGSVASLNVSVSAGVCLYEALRQRMRRD